VDYALGVATLAILVAIGVFTWLIVMREASAAYEERGWGRTLWARLHWITAAIITAIAVGVLLLIELG
jgi:hypothetical protein